jgi:hypothetical protein
MKFIRVGLPYFNTLLYCGGTLIRGVPIFMIFVVHYKSRNIIQNEIKKNAIVLLYAKYETTNLGIHKPMKIL